MDNPNEPSSSPMSFGSSSYISNGSSCFASATSEPIQSLDHLSLTKLSSNLEKLLIDDDFVDYTDAEIVVDGVPVGVHRCILASRSQFFHDLFKRGSGGGGGDDKPKYVMSEFMPFGKVGVEAFDVFLNYLYTGTGKLKASPPDISTCLDENCAHDACPPAINYAVELMYASSVFQMKELVLLVQRRLLNFVEKAFVEDVIPILVAAFHCQLGQLHSSCVQRLAKSNLDDVALEKELPREVSGEIISLRRKCRREEEEEEDEAGPAAEEGTARDKKVGRILRALDSDDVELMNLLLNESDITLDDACALHYSVAYCDPKIVKEILALNLADINLRNRRGHTVLHVAARRKEPSVIVALLERGASAAETTSDGQTAVAICRRLTRPKDYHERLGKETTPDRICVDVLEREMRRNSITGTVSMVTELVADDLHARLDYFDNRVKFAKLLFPSEARIAMEMADAHTSAMYVSLGGSKGSIGNLREVDLNETPSRRTKRLQYKLQTLIKTVENGRRYFPHCSEVLDKFLDDEIDVYVLEKGTPEEQTKKKMRFMELKDEVHKAFSKDMAENNKSVLSSSSSSSSPLKDAAAPTKARKRS